MEACIQVFKNKYSIHAKSNVKKWGYMLMKHLAVCKKLMLYNAPTMGEETDFWSQGDWGCFNSISQFR